MVVLICSWWIPVSYALSTYSKSLVHQGWGVRWWTNYTLATGDLHDGTGLSDATLPDGSLSNPIFENIDYDLLTIGNHELYVTSVAYETWEQFSKKYGDRYVTSKSLLCKLGCIVDKGCCWFMTKGNVQIYNPNKQDFEYIGNKYKYFTTKMGRHSPEDNATSPAALTSGSQVFVSCLSASCTILLVCYSSFFLQSYRISYAKSPYQATPTYPRSLLLLRPLTWLGFRMLSILRSLSICSWFSVGQSIKYISTQHWHRNRPQSCPFDCRWLYVRYNL